jgi:diacylglycerol kinase (ATP)
VHGNSAYERIISILFWSEEKNDVSFGADLKADFMSNDPTRFSWKARFTSFVYAWAGIISFFRTEHNARIHLGATILVAILSFWLKINKTETVAVIFSIAFVWVTEMLNTAIEKAMDFISKERHPQIKHIKDMAAGAVLVAAVVSVVIGGIVFLPKLFQHGALFR